MSTTGQQFLEKMLDRLYKALASGPLLNCRPHKSRQRICLSELEVLSGPRPNEIVQALLSGTGKVRLTQISGALGDAGPGKGRDPKTTLWNKLRTIEKDAAAYDKETGVQVLYVGYPLLNLPPQASRTGSGFAGQRIVAPLAFIPLSLTVNTSRAPSVTLESVGEGAELVIANQALLAFAQSVSGSPAEELFIDELGAEPWREINEIAAVIGKLLQVSPGELLSCNSPVIPFPDSESDALGRPQIIASAVLGLYPQSRQSLLRDLQALIAEGAATSSVVTGPIRAFLDAKVELVDSNVGKTTASLRAANLPNGGRNTAAGIGEDRAISAVDPCQRRAVLLARTASALVLHGPPGTGKSQTIANVIADHLACGLRVLFVCDKRTALDVVHVRLKALGLGHLCAVVHDARRDEKELYRSLREQLDALDQSLPPADVGPKMRQADLELKRVHAELEAYHTAACSGGDASNGNFQELLGQFVSTRVPLEGRVDAIAGITVPTLEAHERSLKELLERGQSVGYRDNPWASVLDCTLQQFLSRPPSAWQQQCQWLLAASEALDLAPGSGTLPLLGHFELSAQTSMLEWLLTALSSVVERQATAKLAYFAAVDPRFFASARAEVLGLLPVVGSLADPRILPQVQSLSQRIPLAPIPELQQWTMVLTEYVEQGDSWFRGVFSSNGQVVRDTLGRFGHPVGVESAKLVLAAIELMRARRYLFDWYQRFFGVLNRVPADGEFFAALELHRVIFEVIEQVTHSPLLSPHSALLLGYVRDPNQVQTLLGVLKNSQIRAASIAKFEEGLSQFKLLRPAVLVELRQRVYLGHSVSPQLHGLVDRGAQVEDLLRIRETLASLPIQLQAAVLRLLTQGTDPTMGTESLRRAVLEGQLRSLLAEFPALTQMDAGRLQSALEHLESVETTRHTLSRDWTIYHWLSRQRSRLLSESGSRLSSLGAELKRRFISRGEKALRLRQAVAVGTDIPGGDPLFDLCPVWMVSPEVTCQLFARTPIFDLVVFDEASQCRLEESLPVLLRGKRVLIAGDPEQLPPTRFFEGTSNADADDTELQVSDQELFEQQQSEVEDLLGASLNLAIEQTYLDVHYRSERAELIAFSNEHFYHGRLEPLPSPPQSRGKLPPILLCQVEGTYENRTNLKEAEAAVGIVRDLLSRASPPSIGIACFNLSQRDAIESALDEAALADAHFGEQLQAAKSRETKGAFEGLFVKNLENVQGDERDHLIISTTYGPDPTGRFYRRFGPLAQSGGGRRLNVLITRARAQIHLLTSIPEAIYRSVPALDADAKPNGGWLLLRYLAFAADLAQAYGSGVESVPPPVEKNANCKGRGSAPLVATLRERLENSSIVTQAPYGSVGLGCDILWSQPVAPHASVGLLIDIQGYARATDPVEWDVFRRSVLARRGFTVRSILSPRLFRNWDEEVGALAESLQFGGQTVENTGGS